MLFITDYDLVTCKVNKSNKKREVVTTKPKESIFSQEEVIARN